MEDVQRENPILDILTEEAKPPIWLVPELFLQGTLVCFAGEPGAGKSNVSYQTALELAAGLPVLGGLFPAQPPKRILYFDEENSEQDRNQYIRWAWEGLKARGRATDDLLFNLVDNFWMAHFQLGGEDWRDRAAEWVEQVQPHVMWFDTATPAFNIGDENSNAEATAALKGIRQLMQMTNPVASAVVLRHAKTRTDGAKRTMRGAKAWHGSADGVIFQVKATGRPKKNGLSLTRMVPDKVRAFGLRNTIYITPEWTDPKRTGLILTGSYTASKDHKKAEIEEDTDE